MIVTGTKKLLRAIVEGVLKSISIQERCEPVYKSPYAVQLFLKNSSAH